MISRNFCPKCMLDSWLLNCPFGHNSVQNSMKNVMEAVGEDSKHFEDSSHSARRTTVTCIMENTHDEQVAKSITGHHPDYFRLQWDFRDSDKTRINFTVNFKRNATRISIRRKERKVFYKQGISLRRFSPRENVFRDIQQLHH